jgi:hypothetical protein
MAKRVRLDEIFPPQVRDVDVPLRRRGGLEANFKGTNYGKHHPRTGHRPSLARMRTILSLEIRGVARAVIAEEMNLSIATVCRLTRRPEYEKMRDEVLMHWDGEFLAMKPLAFTALRNGLTSSEESVALKASDQWFHAAGYGGYSKTPPVDRTVTAEDVVRELMGNVNVNVEVTVNNDK